MPKKSLKRLTKKYDVWYPFFKMKYIFFIIILILSLIIYYKIITPYPFPSKYFSPENAKWHFFTKDKEIIKNFYRPSFFIKSVHISGDFDEIKSIEVQSIAPFFIFKFIKLEGFKLIKSEYGSCFLKEKGNFFNLTENGRSFGWINTNPKIDFKLEKNGIYEFESVIKKVAKDRSMKLKDGFDIEVYVSSSPHFQLLFPEIEDIEIYYKKDKGFLRIRQSGGEKELRFGDFENIKFKEEKLSFYLKFNNGDFLKKYLKNPFLELLKDFEIKCKGEGNMEKCKGHFSLK